MEEQQYPRITRCTIKDQLGTTGGEEYPIQFDLKLASSKTDWEPFFKRAIDRYRQASNPLNLQWHPEWCDYMQFSAETILSVAITNQKDLILAHEYVHQMMFNFNDNPDWFAAPEVELEMLQQLRTLEASDRQNITAYQDLADSVKLSLKQWLQAKFS